MSRESSFIRILDAAVSVQYNTYLILQGKAIEAEKVCQWIMAQYPHAKGDLKGSLTIHEQIVEQIEGLNKIGSGLCRNLRIALGTSEDSDANNIGFEGFNFGDQNL
ncbi:hypothetical protein [Paenibacillus dakarensis]|uniref:hypothetical protein n=1 Tax=Paenibacillus dakarensis TaxID=1527293 RepID=UPI0006D5B161|nr:hypothetical protein [Paenibacillus dakarensis]